LPLVADAALETLGAQAAIVFEVTDEGRLRVAAARNVSVDLAGWSVDADEMGPELDEELRAKLGRVHESVTVIPLVSSGGLFGALAILGAPLSEREAQLATALADFAAISLGRSAQLTSLIRTNAELRASREALARSEKLRALGQMAAGVSHDLKNIMNPLVLHLQVAKRALAKGKNDDVLESIEEMNGVVRRGIEVLERLREFSRQSPDTKTAAVDLHVLAHEAVQLAKPRMSSGKGALSRVSEELAPTPQVVAQSGEIVSAILNLVVNAIDAMPNGGHIVVASGESNGGAFVSVADDGPGMSKEVQERVFEPFFTTKGAEGTGLGLAMVYATVKRYGGTVTLDTAEGKGAKFTLWFPRA
jgi:signal transduction histidine kinase